VREPAAPNPTDLLLRLLPRLAVVGYRVYDTVFRPLSPAEEDALAGVVKQPGILPIVQAAPDTRALPAAILYDQPIDTALAPSDYRLCPVFVEALETPSDPAETPCWQGACPASADQRTVCPSGFWGFRHALGHPFPTGADAGADPAPAVPYEGCPDIVVGFDQGMQMPLAEEHLRELARGCDAWPASHWWQATDLPSLAAALRTTHPHLVYLYAHGQTVDDVPSLRLGGPDAPPILLTDVRRNLRRTGGNGTRPIIVINSDLGGDGLAKYAAAFANDAAGVVGPEVPLLAEDAAAFGEQLVRRLVGGQTVGWAVRDARLDLLRDGSPLGLAYTPFIAPDVGLPGKPSGGAP
jgi:hypothetical protein